MRDIDDLKAIALEYGKRQAPSILTKGEGDEAMSIIDAMGVCVWRACAKGHY